jgi:CMP-N-acetylneuraminic acid synthetase
MSAKHIAIIPARSGSKGIVNKNIMSLDSSRRTITRIACDHALQSKIFSHVILTTDYPKTKIGLDDIKSPTAMTRFECITRPSSLCGDDTNMIDVILHAMEYLGNGYEYVWLLQPTTPFRQIEDFIKIRNVIEDGYYNSVIGFKPVAEHPERMYTVGTGRDDKIKAYPLNKNTGFDNRQGLKEIFIRSGGFYVSKREMILNFKSLENTPVYPHIVDRKRGTNIDSEEDLVLAKHWINKGDIKV